MNNVWLLIARYVSSADLSPAILVCKQWHDTFSKELWGCPTDHFPTQYDGSHDGLARFQRCLSTTRLEIRSLVHTLRISSHDAVYYDQRATDWLRKLLIALPSLQSLIVTGLSFFDHDTLQAAFGRSTQTVSSPSTGQEKQHIGSSRSASRSTQYKESSNDLGLHLPRLRLLDASRCRNLTASSLGAALGMGIHLIYLDLSFVVSARGAATWTALHDLYHLKVLKLRATGIDDKELGAIASAIERRVASLDVRDNRISSVGVNVLLQKCLGAEFSIIPSQIRHAFPHTLPQHDYHADSFDNSLSSILTAGLINQLTIEDTPHLGIQHLAISGNRLQASSLAQLLQCPLLQDLDFGAMVEQDTEIELGFAQTQLLTFLRVDYAVILRPCYSSASAKPKELIQLSMLSRIRTLVLTDVPAFSSTPALSRSIISLIEECSIAAARATTHALTDYTMPPGRQGKTAALQESASQIFALDTIVLEVASQARDEPFGHGKAVTEDFDSEALWSAGQSDFSFFRDDLQPANKPPQSPAAGNARHASHDTIAAVSSFRKARRTAHERNGGWRNSDVITPGHWEGTVKVLRQ